MTVLNPHYPGVIQLLLILEPFRPLTLLNTSLFLSLFTPSPNFALLAPTLTLPTVYLETPHPWVFSSVSPTHLTLFVSPPCSLPCPPPPHTHSSPFILKRLIIGSSHPLHLTLLTPLTLPFLAPRPSPIHTVELMEVGDLSIVQFQSSCELNKVSGFMRRKSRMNSHYINWNSLHKCHIWTAFHKRKIHFWYLAFDFLFQLFPLPDFLVKQEIVTFDVVHIYENR